MACSTPTLKRPNDSQGTSHSRMQTGVSKRRRSIFPGIKREPAARPPPQPLAPDLSLLAISGPLLASHHQAGADDILGAATKIAALDAAMQGVEQMESMLLEVSPPQHFATVLQRRLAATRQKWEKAFGGFDSAVIKGAPPGSWVTVVDAVRQEADAVHAAYSSLEAAMQLFCRPWLSTVDGSGGGAGPQPLLAQLVGRLQSTGGEPNHTTHELVPLLDAAMCCLLLLPSSPLLLQPAGCCPGGSALWSLLTNSTAGNMIVREQALLGVLSTIHEEDEGQLDGVGDDVGHADDDQDAMQVCSAAAAASTAAALVTAEMTVEATSNARFAAAVFKLTNISRSGHSVKVISIRTAAANDGNAVRIGQLLGPANPCCKYAVLVPAASLQGCGMRAQLLAHRWQLEEVPLQLPPPPSKRSWRLW
eukprot:SAG22_NODE_520_length_9508_cov_1.914869_4_plen_420_part_00